MIKSRHQLDYYQAQAIHDRVKVPTPVASIAGDRAETEAVARDLDALAGFAEALRAARVARGAVELIGGLGGEYTRWKADSEAFADEIRRLAGDVALAFLERVPPPDGLARVDEHTSGSDPVRCLWLS